MPSASSHTINDYESLLVALQNVLGVVVPEGQRSNLVERVEPLLSVYKLDSLAELAKCLQAEQAGEVKSDVLDAISQHHPNWALSADMVSILRKYIFEQLPNNARIWLVGCGQGQLAYAIAIQLAEYVNQTNDIKNIQIIGTDGSASNITKAKSATYTEEQLSGLSAEYRKLYTTKTNKPDTYQLKDRVTDFVSFKQYDLTGDMQSLGEMDLIICPDALVYFSTSVKDSILQQLSSLLKSGGIFLAGNNQTMIPNSDSFERVNHSAGVFYRRIN